MEEKRVRRMVTSVSATLIESTLYDIRRYLIRRYGVDQADRDMAPLEWYVYTGRASTVFLRRLAGELGSTIGRLLHNNQTHDGAITAVKRYLED